MSMPSRASTSLLQKGDLTGIDPILACQCPHGLVPHCYRDAEDQVIMINPCVNALTG